MQAPEPGTDIISIEQPRTTRVAIAASHPAVRTALEQLVKIEPGLRLVDRAGADVIEAERLLDRHAPHVLLLSLKNMLADDAAIVRRLRARAAKTKLVLASTAVGASYARLALAAGAAALVPLDGSATELLQALRDLTSGPV
jgi:DNA-binding NarL/FixJ family response regulator